MSDDAGGRHLHHGFSLKPLQRRGSIGEVTIAMKEEKACASALLSDPEVVTDLRGLLAESKVFQFASQRLLERLLEAMRPFTVAAGAMIFGCGERGNWTALIRNGDVDVLLEHTDGSSLKVAQATRGSIIGDASMFGIIHRRATTILTLTPCEVWVVTRPAFDRIVHDVGWPPEIEIFKNSTRNAALMADAEQFIRLECFKGMDQALVRALHRHSLPRVAYAGEMIMEEGTIGNEMYILLQGSVRVERGGEVICVLPSGVAIGEVAVLGPSKMRTATVLCQVACMLRALYCDTFHYLFKRFQESDTVSDSSESSWTSVALVGEEKSFDDLANLRGKRASTTVASGAAEVGVALQALGPQQRGVRRPHWRLFFQGEVDVPGLTLQGGLGSSSPSTAGAACRTRRQNFFVTVVDPPVGVMSREPEPIFASPTACAAADVIASQSLSQRFPRGGLEGRVIAAVGRDSVAAGLAAAMLGAHVAFLSERRLLQDVSHNVRLYARDAIDYGRGQKRAPVALTGIYDIKDVCDRLQLAPFLDLVLLTQSMLGEPLAPHGAGAIRGATFDGVPLATVLDGLCPDGASTRVLLVGSLNEKAAKTAKTKMASEGSFNTSEDWDFNASEAESATLKGQIQDLDLPPAWATRPFAAACRNAPVVWLERRGRERRGLVQSTAAGGQRLPPMGLPSPRCGCGGLPLQKALGMSEAQEWLENNRRLKESLSNHNLSKHQQSSSMLSQARAYAARARQEDGRRAAHAGLAPGAFRNLSVSTAVSMEVLDDFAGDADFAALDARLAAEQREALARAATGAAGGGLDHGGSWPSPWLAAEAAALEAELEAEASGDLEAADWATALAALDEGALRSAGAGPAARRRGGPRRSPRSPRRPNTGAARPAMRLPNLRPQPLSARGPSSSRGILSSSGSQLSIVERHTDPPFWYRCNRPLYG